ncbi:HNH endonuclease [Nocardia sp. NPDC058658]|uniref:HNH endonuclease n=1 Tax=Nocardia sp. NPDC058658 TaxID=3346580 RepID=UPI0036687D08
MSANEGGSVFRRGQRVRVHVDGLPAFAIVRHPIPNDETGGVDLILVDDDDRRYEVNLAPGDTETVRALVSDGRADSARVLAGLWTRWMDAAATNAESSAMASTPLKPYAHQTTAVYGAMLPQPQLRFLLADEPGVPMTPKWVPQNKLRRLREVAQRQGQGIFRDNLRRAYGDRCAITGCDVPAVLQAAHIDPYSGTGTNHIGNGLLLRADVHDLFDRGLLWVTAAMRVAVHRSLHDTEYGYLHGRKLRLPERISERPLSDKLAEHQRSATRDERMAR